MLKTCGAFANPLRWGGMARFFLHLEDSQGGCIDVEGFHAVDNAQAWAIMRQAAADIVGEEFSSGFSPVSFVLCLDDEAGRRIAALPIKASLGPPLS
jgi:hypothetical protein